MCCCLPCVPCVLLPAPLLTSLPLQERSTRGS